MTIISLFRSAVLDEHGQQIIKAIVVGDDLDSAIRTAFEAWLGDPTEHLVALNPGVRVEWLG